MNLNASNVTVTITLAFNTPEERAKASAIVDKLFNDGIAPQDAVSVNAQQTVPMGEGRPSVEAMHAAGPITDKNGLPWDERIHSSSKAFNADGSWRYRKGCPDNTKRDVEAQLRAAVAGNAAPAATTAATLPPPPAAPAPLPPPPAPPAPAPVAENPAYSEFVQLIAANTAPAGRIPGPEWVQQTLVAYGVPDGSLQNLAHMPDKIPVITAAIKQALGIA